MVNARLSESMWQVYNLCEIWGLKILGLYFYFLELVHN